MGRSPCCSKEGLNKGAWTALEDKILKDHIKVHGEKRWRNVPKEAGLKRCGKSCRLRWLNYLRPDIKRGNISHDEEDLIIRLHRLLGNRWSLIAGRLPGRTDNEIKNYWNTNLAKKAQGKQSNESKNEKTPMFTPLDEAKALRCTEVLVTPQQGHKAESFDSKVTVGPSVNGNLVKNTAATNGPSSFTSREDNSSDFMMDLSMEEICLSEILDDPNFTKPSDFDTCELNNVIDGDGTNYSGCKSELSPLSDEIFLLSDEMVENWSGSDCVQADMASNFLASFLESANDQWIGDDLSIVYQN